MSVNTSLMLVDNKLVKDFIKNKKVKPLTKKQVQVIVELMDHREQRAQLKGFNDGREIEKREHKPTIKLLNDDTVMALGNICNSNAQLATALARLIEKETTR